MIILDEAKLSQFFESVSSGFIASPLEIVLVIALLLGFISFLVIMHRLQRIRVRRESARRSAEHYAKLAQKLDLNPSEHELIERLAEYLKQPEKKYLLVVNQSTFNNCLLKLKNKEGVPEVAVSGLRLKLGFSAEDPEKVPVSSVELPEEVPVVLLAAGAVKVAGRVVENSAQYMAVQLNREAPAFRTGAPVTVYFQNRSGVFSFATSVQARKSADLLYLDHTDTIARYQRRKYYRRKIMLPVFIRPAGSEEKPVRTVLIDLGGGGASLQSPQHQFEAGFGSGFKRGMDVELSFHPAGGGRLFVVAEVVRVSRNGGVLHLRFGPLRDSTRDRIMGYLFRGRK